MSKHEEKDVGLTALWAEPPFCAECGNILVLKSVHVEDFPYIHADVRLECGCGEIYLHGIPKRKDTGLALHVMDTNPAFSVAYMDALAKKEQKNCPYQGHGKMLPTKVFGDWVFKKNEIEYQWKCPVCFLTRHELHKRTFDHGDEFTFLDDEEQDIMRERLRRMGYIE